MIFCNNIHCCSNRFILLYFIISAGAGGPGTPGSTGQPSAGEGGSNTVRKRQKTSSDPESDASESKLGNWPFCSL